MSDTPQTSEWWLASDGKWYPPTSLPGAAPLPPLPPGRTTSVSRALASWTQGLLWIAAGMSGVLFVTTARALSTFEDYTDGRVGWSRFSDAGDSHIAVAGLWFLLFLVTGIVMVVWTFKAYRATERLQPAYPSWSAGWAVGGWFIPLAGAIIPKLVLNEVERLATAPRTAGQVDPSWREQSTSALGWFWWISFVIATFFLVAASGLEEGALDERAHSSIRAGYMFWLGAGAAFATAGVLGALFVRRLSSHLSPWALDQPDQPNW